MPTDIDLVPRVRAILEDSATQRKTITFGEIERRVGEKIAAWNKVLDPIYDDSMAQGHPDLTAIVIYKETGYPPFFSDGGDARSKRFNPPGRVSPLIPAFTTVKFKAAASMFVCSNEG